MASRQLSESMSTSHGNGNELVLHQLAESELSIIGQAPAPRGIIVGHSASDTQPCRQRTESMAASDSRWDRALFSRTVAGQSLAAPAPGFSVRRQSARVHSSRDERVKRDRRRNSLTENSRISRLATVAEFAVAIASPAGSEPSEIG